MHGTPSSRVDRSIKEASTEQVIKKPVEKPQLDDFDDDDEEDSVNEGSKNSLIDDEAEEAEDDYKEGNSIDSVIRKYMEAQEVPMDGVSLGSQDTDNEEEEDDEMDSFIVTDEEEDLLDGSGDDLSYDDEKPKKKSKRSVLRLPDSSDEDKVEERSKENKVPEEGQKEEAPKADPNVSSIDVSERQTNKLLSKTVLETEKKKEAKHNKSLTSSLPSEHEISFSSYIDKNKKKKYIFTDDEISKTFRNLTIARKKHLLK